MKQKVKMLATLDGVDEGKIYPSTYHEGEEYEIGEELVQCFVELGGVELTGLKPRDLAEGEMLVEGDQPEDIAANPAANREQKVTGPQETKPAAPAKKKK